MLELMLVSIFTVLPDFLFRRFVQGKRIGREINIFSVWFELRWGIVSCLILTILLITTIFYFHPATHSAVSFFRTVPIISEGPGRVAEVYVTLSQKVKRGDRIFKLDSTEEEAAVETAKRRSAEVDASLELAKSDLLAAESSVDQAQTRLRSTEIELARQLELQRREPSAVAQRMIDQLELQAEERRGSLAEAIARKQTIERQISTLLPAQKASAVAALAQAEATLAKTVIYAGVDGTVEQFTLRVGDIVNPFMRPAGILVPSEAGRLAIQAGFDQIGSQVIKPGMVAEATCVSKPFVIIPLVVAQVQNVIAAGQIRPTDQLLDPKNVGEPGSLTVHLEPLVDGALDGVRPGSACIANAYTNNHEKLESGDLSTLHWLLLHAVDAVGILHAGILRIQALFLPVQTLVLTGGH